MHRINIKTNVENYDEVLNDLVISDRKQGANIYLPVSIEIDGQLLDSVGIRYKGASSYQPQMSKKSLKIDFNEFQKGQKFQGLKKLNLHNSFADASFIRDPMSYKLFREMGVLAPRTSFAQVYIDNNYAGVYQIVEQIDNVYTDGALFKNMKWANFKYRGRDPNNYRGQIDLKGNASEEDWQDLTAFLKFIDDEAGTDFSDSIQYKLDVKNFIKVLVVLTATNNYDSIIKTGRNWYLNQPEDSSRFKIIPWDGNMAFSAVFPSQYENCEITPQFFFLKEDKKSYRFYDDSEYYTDLIYRWEFGDGNTSNLPNPIHTYKRHGNYEVCLNLSILDYCEKSICLTINTRKDQQTCMSDPNSKNNYKFYKVISQKPGCCEEWNDECDKLYQNITEQQFYSFGFFPQVDEQSLAGKVLSIPRFRRMYQKEMCTLLKNYYTSSYVNDYINQMTTLIKPALADDQNALQPYQEFLFVTEINKSRRNIRNIINERIAELKSYNLCNTQ
ncbi:CotH kinase family protein [Portibacter marinus]|uniref:CotH kinase family protein n=1 Tax=Portibacter marinus TaxID=2898660 RepID=UPI001F4168D9|nr:CotH kinase family protein [Portibacter marinus]